MRKWKICLAAFFILAVAAAAAVYNIGCAGGPDAKSVKAVSKTRQRMETYTSPAPRIVAIDPGHQGENIDMTAREENAPGSGIMKQKATSGTEGSFTGLPEYQLNLDVALKVRDRLAEKGYQVVMTREDNETAVSNQERAKLANDSGADICVRIHANGSESTGSSGALCLIMSEGNPYVGNLEEQSRRLADHILNAYCAATGFSNQGVRTDDNMTGINWSQIPVVILEMGFMTNEHDDAFMADSSFQESMADGIVQGIEEFYEENGQSFKGV